MTLNQLIQLFKNIGDSHYFINTFEFGEVPDKVDSNTTTTLYPACYAVPQNTTTKDNTTERTITLIICDLVNTDHSNINEILNDCELTLNDYIKIFRLQSDDYTLVNEPQLIPFKDGFGDGVAGWYAQLTIETVNNNGFCDIPALDFGYPNQGGTPGMPNPSAFDCDTLNTCETIVNINEDLSVLDSTVIDLQNQIDNLPAGFSCDDLENCEIIIDTLDRMQDFDDFVAESVNRFEDIEDDITAINNDITNIENDLINNYVPYLGANKNIDTGEYGISTGFVKLDLTPTNTPTNVGTLSWNDIDGTADLKLKGGNVTLQIGQEIVKRVVNKSGSNLLESHYYAVRIVGATGQRMSIDLAMADDDLNSATTIGIVTENINNNQEGFITTSGEVKEINTTGSLQSETWSDGDVLYLSPVNAGHLTNVKPVAPNHMVIIGYVEYAHINHGKIFVKIDNGYELDELHNVLITSAANNDILAFDLSTSTWQNKTSINLGLQSTLVSGTNIKTINGTTLLGSGNLQVGTILGTLPAVAGFVPFGNGTLDTVEVLNNGTFGYNFKFLKNNVQAGYTVPSLAIGTAFNGFAGNFHATTSVAGVLIAGYTLEDTNNGGACYLVRGNNTSQASFYAYSSGMAGVHTGTNINLAGTNGIISSNTFSYNPTGTYVQKQAVLVNIIGSTSTNIGSRLDATGLRIDAINTLHTANTNLFQVGSNLTFNGTTLNVGNATPLVTQDFNVAKSLAGVGAAVGFSITNTNSTGVVSNNFGESLNNRLTLGKYGSTSSQAVAGTSLNYQNTSVVASTAGGNFGVGNLYIQGSPIINIIGITSTNYGSRLDQLGLRIDTLNNIHTANTNPFQVGANLIFNGTSLNVGSATPFATSDINVARTNTGNVLVGMTVTNSSTTGLTGIYMGESNGTRMAMAKYGSTFSSVIAGTSVNLQNSLYTLNLSAGGATGPIINHGGSMINIIGSTGTNIGSRLDSVGLRLDTISSISTTNLNTFTVNGRSFFGGNTTSTAIIHIASGTTANAQLRLASGVAPTTPNDGDIWFDGTNIKMRVAGVTKTFTLV